MITYGDGRKVRVEISKIPVPATGDNFVGLTLNEEMESVFTKGSFVFADKIGLMSEKPIRGGEDLDVIITQSDDSEIKYSYSITEEDKVTELTQNSSACRIMFLSKGYRGMMTPKYSRSFGTASGSSVVKDICSPFFTSVDVDNSFGRDKWIQPYYNNKDMVKFISKKVYSMVSGLNDFMYFNSKEDVFFFKSLGSLIKKPATLKFSSYPIEGYNLIDRIIVKNKSNLWLPLKGYGRQSFYFDEVSQSYKSDKIDLGRVKIPDLGKSFGFNIPDGLSPSIVDDYGISKDLVVDLKKIAANADYWFSKSWMVSQEIEIVIPDFSPDIKLGAIVELRVMLDESIQIEAYSGSWLLIGIEIIFRFGGLKTNLRLYRLGHNDSEGSPI